ncbi:DUF1525 domain-containing protein [Lampropedia puyangensis]|uniref:DUF1525 domain-containing protein n=1 Tax=Lampropedia puyangensis TaxID=1330072 RepID=A0A4S8EU46_9BURK|nr:DUF1525 domain-containing protein [Lampropedia puyangensis]THT98409.1 DUF1525 domain-containing protein [Lampropedia puyangensis]
MQRLQHTYPESSIRLRCVRFLTAGRAVTIALSMVLVQFTAYAQDTNVQAFEGISHIDVFANSAMYINGGDLADAHVQLAIHRLDDMQMVTQEINQHLPKTQEQALAYMRENESRMRAQYTDRILLAAQGITLARQYKLKQLPAVVINQKYVLYGLLDLQEAAAIYQERKAGPQ